MAFREGVVKLSMYYEHWIYDNGLEHCIRSNNQS